LVYIKKNVSMCICAFAYLLPVQGELKAPRQADV
jgi:hypothetical protein